MAQDPYSELGVGRDASQADIKKAFHKRAKELHPDRNPGDKKAEERFKKVSAAFDILGDAEKRKRFDRGEIDADGNEVFRGFGGGGHPGGGFGQGGFGQNGSGFGGRFDNVDLDEIFSMFGGGVGGGPGRGRPRPEPRGVDVRAKVEVDLEDMIRGGQTRIAFSDGRTVDVTIPKGAYEGQVLRLKGQGQQGRGGMHGDALLELTARPHPIYRQEGADLVMDLPVSIPDAVLGGKVQAPTPEGAVALNVPKGSSSGAMLRLKGRGAYDKSGKRGDLKARIMLALPEGSDPALEAFAEQWRQERPYSPRRRGG